MTLVMILRLLMIILAAEMLLRMNLAMKMLGRIFVRRMTSLAHPLPKPGKGQYPVPNTPQYKKLMEKQSFFCANDGKLVWQKRPMDSMLYFTSCGLVLLGFVMTLDTIRQLAAPPKND